MTSDEKSNALEYLDHLDKKLQRKNEIIITLCVLLGLFVL